MFKINKHGKVSCLLGAPAFVLCLLAEHSRQYRVADKESPFLSVAANWILTPINYIKGLFAPERTYIGPEFKSLGTEHVFEHEAIIIFFVIGVLLSFSALMLSSIAVRQRENSIWYANGIFASLSALLLLNGYFGVIMSIIVLAVVNKLKNGNEN